VLRKTTVPENPESAWHESKGLHEAVQDQVGGANAGIQPFNYREEDRVHEQ
jgi:hypothetical protein